MFGSRKQAQETSTGAATTGSPARGGQAEKSGGERKRKASAFSAAHKERAKKHINKASGDAAVGRIFGKAKAKIEERKAKLAEGARKK